MPSVQGLNEAVLEAAAKHCRELLSKSDVQSTLAQQGSGRKTPKSVEQRWQSVAGTALSSLAPHDGHAGASQPRVMPR